MKIIALLFLALGCVGCAPQMAALKPNHIGLTPSCEWEIQEGNKVKHKPKALVSIDWNM